MHYDNFLLHKLNSCRGNYSREETICGNTVFGQIRQDEKSAKPSTVCSSRNLLLPASPAVMTPLMDRDFVYALSMCVLYRGACIFILGKITYFTVIRQFFFSKLFSMQNIFAKVFGQNEFVPCPLIYSQSSQKIVLIKGE